jgi:D-mannonate dehydratase
MGALVNVFLEEIKLRSARLPMRPDHGIKSPEDEGLSANPGYPKFGRLKGLKEIERP